MSGSDPFDESLLDAILDGQAVPLDGGSAVDRLIGLVGSPRAEHGRNTAPPPTAEELVEAGLDVHGLLGRGAHASVYAATDLTLGRPIALKVVHAGVADAAARRTFLREARTLARIDHPNVVRIWSAVARGERLLLALERIEGETLRERVLRDGPLPSRLAVRIALDVARGLSAVHAAGILHRDLNPGNVMLRSDGRAVLLDFSLARSDTSERLERGGTIGSPAYEAPEVLAGGEPSQRSDVYALGMLLVWMLSGIVPLRGATWAELRRSAIDGTRVPLRELCRGLPGRLVAVLEGATAIDPARRTHDARALADNLERALTRTRRHAVAFAGIVAAICATWLVSVGLGRLAEILHGVAERRQEPIARAEVERFTGVERPAGLAELWQSGPVLVPEPYGDGRTLRVRTGLATDYASIQAAVNASLPGDVIVVGPGDYPERILLRGRSLTMFALAGPEVTTLRGGAASGSVLQIDNRSGSEAGVRVRVVGFGITGGEGTEIDTTSSWSKDRYGGGVSIHGPLVNVSLERCALWGNGSRETTFGGGLALLGNLDTEVTLEHCLVVGNAAWACGGGVLVDDSRLVMRRCTVVDNISGDFDGLQGGIGLANNAHLTIEDSIVWGNYGAQIGGFEHHDKGVHAGQVGCLVQGAHDSEFDESELFVAAPRSDWRLRPAAVAELGGTVPGALPAWLGAESDLPPLSRRETWPRRLGACPKGVRDLGALDPAELPPGAFVLRVPADRASIQQALDDAPTGAWILVAPGIYYEALTLPPRSLHLVGEHGAGETVVDAVRSDAVHGSPAVVDLKGGRGPADVRVLVRGLTLRSGRGRPHRYLGGGIAVSGAAELELSGCVVWQCGHVQRTLLGGAAWVADGARLVARDVLFARNVASTFPGGVLAVEQGSLVLENCTLFGGASASLPGLPNAILLRGASRLDVRRSVLWGELESAILFEADAAGEPSADVRDSIVVGGWEGPGVIDLDPGFVDPEHDDWSLAPGGPAQSRGLGLRMPGDR